jgi:hypothetical protein
MPKMLVDGGVEYDDGTPSCASQQAKVGPAAALAALGLGRGPACAMCCRFLSRRGRAAAERC